MVRVLCCAGGGGLGCLQTNEAGPKCRLESPERSSPADLCAHSGAGFARLERALLLVIHIRLDRGDAGGSLPPRPPPRPPLSLSPPKHISGLSSAEENNAQPTRPFLFASLCAIVPHTQTWSLSPSTAPTCAYEGCLMPQTDKGGGGVKGGGNLKEELTECADYTTF